jgi:hypothetical protein
MADLLVRFHFMYERGGEIGYFYSREVAKDNLPPPDKMFNIQTLKIGDTLNIEGKIREVADIHINLHPEREGTLTGVGVAIYNMDTITPYDITITVYFK